MMQRRRRTASLLVLGVLAALWIGVLAAPAGAEVRRGGCTGAASFSNGVVVTESQPIDQVVLVPDKDTVFYTGSINLPPPDEAVPFNGGVNVKLPLGSWTVVTWAGETEEVSAEGTHTYEVPSYVPRGTGGLEVTAAHKQQGQDCLVAVTMALEGDPGVEAIVAAAGAAVFFAGTMAAGIKKKGG